MKKIKKYFKILKLMSSGNGNSERRVSGVSPSGKPSPYERQLHESPKRGDPIKTILRINFMTEYQMAMSKGEHPPRAEEFLERNARFAAQLSKEDLHRLRATLDFGWLLSLKSEAARLAVIKFLKNEEEAERFYKRIKELAEKT